MKTKQILEACKECSCNSCNDKRCRELACSVCNEEYPIEKCKGFISEGINE